MFCALGQTIVGKIVSAFVTLKVKVAVFPAASVAVKVIGVTVPLPLTLVPATGD